MKRTALVSYLAIPGVPVGFHKMGIVDVFTENYAPMRASDPSNLYKKGNLLKELHGEVMKRIKKYSRIYVYICRFPDMDNYEGTWPVFTMVEEYSTKRPDIQLIIVGCTCGGAWKQSFVDRSLGRITWEIVPCNPEKELLAIIERENKLVSAIAE
jgi:hypothetical protein